MSTQSDFANSENSFFSQTVHNVNGTQSKNTATQSQVQ